MDIQLDVIGYTLLVVVFANSLLGFLVYFNNQKRDELNRSYFTMALAIDIWVVAMFFFRALLDEWQVRFFAHVLYASFTLVPLSFFYFSATFFERKISQKRRLLINGLFVISLLLAIVPGFLITGTELRLVGENAIFFGGIPSVVYSAYTTLAMGFGYLYLADYYRKAKDKHAKLQALFVIIGTLVAAGTGFLTNLLLPFFQVFTFNWMSQLTIMVMVGIIAVAIMRYQLFNLKVLLTQALVFLIWTTSLYQLLVSSHTTALLLVGLVSLGVTIVVGLLLIRSVKKEVAQRENLETLSKKLKDLNSELQKLDQMKTEFLSLASHQLRTPLTSIKGYSSMILEGSFGRISESMKKPVGRIFESSTILAKIIADLLDVSKIEQGGLQYEMLTFSMASMVQSVADEQKISAKDKGVSLSFEMKQPGRYALKGDSVKLRQVLVNLVDNAIKYTDPGGAVEIILEKRKTGDNRFICLQVKDNGRGISKETQRKLFQKFSRGNAGKETNTSGSGLGLYLAYQIVKAHAGTLEVSSEGEGKGTVFTATFPQRY